MDVIIQQWMMMRQEDLAQGNCPLLQLLEQEKSATHVLQAINKLSYIIKQPGATPGYLNSEVSSLQPLLTERFHDLLGLCVS